MKGHVSIGELSNFIVLRRIQLDMLDVVHGLMAPW